MGTNFITNVKDPLSTNSHYVATVNFVNTTVTKNNETISILIEDLNIKAAKQEHVFSFIMDDDLFKEDDSDITKVGKVNKDFCKVHKEIDQFDISHDISIDLKALNLGEFTLVF